MRIDTKYHGTIDYKEEDIITFEKGIPAFEEYKKFILFPVEGNDFFSVLHSLEDAGLGFIVVSPFKVMKEYEIELPQKSIEDLNIEAPEDVIVQCTITLSSKIEDITSNFQAPIVINTKNNRGEQIVLSNDKYSIKYPLFKEGIN